MTSSERRLLRTEEAALYLGLASGTLENWRTKGRGPRWLRPSRIVVYDIRDLDAWVDAERRQTIDERSSKTRSRQ